MKKPLLSLLPLALLCAAGLWLANRGDDPDLSPPPHLQEPAEAGIDPGLGNASEATTAVDATGAGGGPAARDAVLTHEALVALPADAKWIDVRVVDRDTREAVPGAEVSWYDDTVTKALQKRPELVLDRIGLWRDQEAIALQFGWRTRSDANGIARIHQTQNTHVCARLGDRFGHAALGANLVPPRGGHTIAIEADFAVRVQVLDAAGSPAIGVPIGIARHDARGKFQGFRNWGAEALTCAPDGIAVLPHAQEWRRESKETPQWRVHANLPGGSDEQGATVQFDPPPTAPIVLRLPECGIVRVRVDLRADGEPGQRVAALRENNRGGSRGWARNLQEPLGPDGFARFAYVPLGLQLTAGISANGGWLSQNFAGPVAAGAVVDVTLAPHQSHVLFTGRLLDEHRQPMARQRFAIRTTGNNGNNCESTTGDGGEFLVLIGNVRNEHNTIDAIVATATPTDGRARAARLPGRELRAGTENLGDLVLGFDPIVVAGHYVVDGKVQKAEASAMVERLQQPRENDRNENWERVDDLPQPSQQDDGSFEVRGVVPQGRYRLRVWPNRAAPVEPIEFRLGATDVTVEFHTTGGLAATVLMPGDSGGLNGRLVPVDAPVAASLPANQKRRLETESWARPEDRQQLDWQPLPDGTYRLELLLPGFPDDVVAAVDGVQIPAPAGGDPRLVDIDLRALVRHQEIRITDDAGKPVQVWEGGMFPMPQARKQIEGLPPRGATASYLMPKRAIDLLVAYPGFRPRNVTCSGQPVELRLDRWPTVTLTFGALPTLPEGCELSASLEAQADPDDRQFRSAWNSGPLSRLLAPPRTRVKIENGKAELPVSEAQQRIVLQVRKQRRSVNVVIPPQTVSLATRTVAVQFTPEAVQKAAAEAAAKKE